MENIRDNAKYLRLPYLRDNYKEMIREAEINEQSLIEFLDNILIQESETRFSNGVKRKIKQAKFPNKLYLENFTLNNYDAAQKRAIKEVITLNF